MGLLCKEESQFLSQLLLFLEIIKHDLRKGQQLKALRLVFSLCKAAEGLFFSVLHISSSALWEDRKPVALKTSTCILGGLRCYMEIVGLGQCVSDLLAMCLRALEEELLPAEVLCALDPIPAVWKSHCLYNPSVTQCNALPVLCC